MFQIPLERMYIYMGLKFRRQVRGTGGARFGSSGSHLNIAQDGRQTMEGAARVYKDIWVPAPNFFLHAASAPNGLVFTDGSMMLTYKTIAFSKGSASVFSGLTAGCAYIPVMTNAAASPGSGASLVFATTVVPKPTDAATTGCINVRQIWGVTDTRLTSNSSMAFVVGAAYLTNGASLRTAASCGTAGSHPSTNASVFSETSLGYLPSWGENDTALVLTAGMDWASSSTSNGSGFAILGYKLRYVANSLGTQVT